MALYLVPQSLATSALEAVRDAEIAWQKAVGAHNARFEQAMRKGLPYDPVQAGEEIAEIGRLFTIFQETKLSLERSDPVDTLGSQRAYCINRRKG